MPRFIIVDEGTIREHGDEEESPRSKKRQRVDEDEPSNEKLRKIMSDGTEILIHDPHYHLRDDPQADCYVRVEKVLFKIHGHLLFMSPNLKARLQDGLTGMRAEPLELFGISVEEFRALLWARYASEDDVKNQPRDQDGLWRLLRLATVTQAYSFQELHAWTIKTMYAAFDTDAAFADTCTSATFTRVVEVATRCKAHDLLDAAVSKWSDRIRRRDIAAVPAILAADEHKLVGLRGIAYYVHLQEIIEKSAPTTPADALLLFSTGLSEKQRIRLLLGHLSLVSFWERRRRDPPKLECADGCSTAAHRTCDRVWNEQWQGMVGSQAVLRHNSADILAILQCMRDQLGIDQGVAQGVALACRTAGLDALRQELCDVRVALPEHFGC